MRTRRCWRRGSTRWARSSCATSCSRHSARARRRCRARWSSTTRRRGSSPPSSRRSWHPGSCSPT
eukprot:scaffold42606_cov41-Phaeocystis_antarctica.AAC.1